MSGRAVRHAGAADDALVRAALEPALAGHFGAPCRVTHLARRASPYGSSFRLEELDVTLDGGRRLAVVFKDVSPHAWLDAARDVKPRSVYDPRREIEAYHAIVPTGPPGPPTCYGAVADDAAARYWLFLERVDGWLLSEVGEFAVWERAAEWLATLHAHHAVATEWRAARHLLRRDAVFYRGWRSRAEAVLRRQGSERVREFAPVARAYDAEVQRLAALPTTFVHGDFHAANVITHGSPEQVRICPVDWEMAGEGPGLLDLAALTSGKWTAGERRALALAYHRALAAAGAPLGDAETFFADLDRCRLHLAVQWLGWAPAWSPPPHQAHDWIAEARRAVEALEAAAR